MDSSRIVESRNVDFIWLNVDYACDGDGIRIYACGYQYRHARDSGAEVLGRWCRNALTVPSAANACNSSPSIKLTSDKAAKEAITAESLGQRRYDKRCAAEVGRLWGTATMMQWGRGHKPATPAKGMGLRHRLPPTLAAIPMLSYKCIQYGYCWLV
jgi:hypothetical protein